MARLGIDFGTTNTVAAIHDRGVFSLVLHEATTGVGTITQETFPSAILIDRKTGQRYFGLEADRRFSQLGPREQYVFIPSLKRQLREYMTGRRVEQDGVAYDPGELLVEFLQSLRASIVESQSIDEDEMLETVITWPANSNGAQRLATRQAFREAGFHVIDSITEPTASAIELADWIRTGNRNSRKQPTHAVAVFDLGGGTFDASVVGIQDTDFHVLASGGIETLGGDDFDRALYTLFLEKMKTREEELTSLTRHALLRHARAQKETISTGAVRSLFLNPMDFGLEGRPASIAIETFNERIRAMLEPAVGKLKEVIDAAVAHESRISDRKSIAIYLVGGSSKLPLVGEMVKAAFADSKVVLSDKPFRSVAMGAAICAADRVTFQDVFARHFGLIRLTDHGRREMFDTIFSAGTPVPRRGEPPLEKVTWYRPVHNIGRLRYLECTDVDDAGKPGGSVRQWTDILFPYDPAAPIHAPVDDGSIREVDGGVDPVCEVYRCDSDGVITVELQRPAANDSRQYEIGRD